MCDDGSMQWLHITAVKPRYSFTLNTSRSVPGRWDSTQQCAPGIHPQTTHGCPPCPPCLLFPAVSPHPPHSHSHFPAHSPPPGLRCVRSGGGAGHAARFPAHAPANTQASMRHAVRVPGHLPGKRRTSTSTSTVPGKACSAGRAYESHPRGRCDYTAQGSGFLLVLNQRITANM